MKTLVHLTTIAVLATALLSNVSAADLKPGKGPGVKIVSGENVLMTCPHCKDKYAVKVTSPPKGTAPEKVTVGSHLCEQCGTKLVIKGGGKSKELVSEHTCKGCTAHK